jgi:hypothetical protein
MRGNNSIQSKNSAKKYQLQGRWAEAVEVQNWRNAKKQQC